MDTPTQEVYTDGIQRGDWQTVLAAFRESEEPVEEYNPKRVAAKFTRELKKLAATQSPDFSTLRDLIEMFSFDPNDPQFDGIVTAIQNVYHSYVEGGHIDLLERVHYETNVPVRADGGYAMLGYLYGKSSNDVGITESYQRLREFTSAEGFREVVQLDYSESAEGCLNECIVSTFENTGILPDMPLEFLTEDLNWQNYMPPEFLTEEAGL
tara:strand:+ start:261 stop:890 length:630 start_codon:yes stop_codon:yes gene_type:complete